MTESPYAAGLRRLREAAYQTAITETVAKITADTIAAASKPRTATVEQVESAALEIHTQAHRDRHGKPMTREGIEAMLALAELQEVVLRAGSVAKKATNDGPGEGE